MDVMIKASAVACRGRCFSQPSSNTSLMYQVRKILDPVSVADRSWHTNYSRS